MGREVRRVSADWVHPKKEGDDRYIPLLPDYAEAVANFMMIFAKSGLQKAIDYHGVPDKKNYMPEWLESEKTHYMMYEITSEGTPKSPAFSTPEELAHWLADTGASAFGSMTADYEHWLYIARGNWAPSAIMSNDDKIQSGVEAANLINDEKVNVEMDGSMDQ